MLSMVVSYRKLKIRSLSVSCSLHFIGQISFTFWREQLLSSRHWLGSFFGSSEIKWKMIISKIMKLKISHMTVIRWQINITTFSRVDSFDWGGGGLRKNNRVGSCSLSKRSVCYRIRSCFFRIHRRSVWYYWLISSFSSAICLEVFTCILGLTSNRILGRFHISTIRITVHVTDWVQSIRTTKLKWVL